MKATNLTQFYQYRRYWSKRSKIQVMFVFFYCKLNFIEYYWEQPNDMHEIIVITLQETVPRALDSVNLVTIRRFARKTWRY